MELHHEIDGAGRPVLLLHGFPETLRCWDAVVDRLRGAFTLVRPDLRGYGASPKPRGDYSKRAMAADALALMRGLGHERFAVVGHDRGGLVGQRLALDHPEAVSTLAVLDIVPVSEMWDAVNADVAVAAYHLFLLAQPPDLPERLIAGDPTGFVDSFLDGWSARPGAIPDAARRAYHDAIRAPDAIRAICDDYRAGATVDLEHDHADQRAGRRIEAPVTILWQAPGGSPPPFDPIAIWQRWATQVSGHGVDCGHFLPEEAPDEVARAIRGLGAA